MRRVLGSVLPALALTGLLAGFLSGCGDDSAPVADDPAPTASSTGSSTGSSAGSTPTDAVATPSPVPVGGKLDVEVADTVTETAAGGSVTIEAVLMTDEGALGDFVSPFKETLQTAVRDAVAAITVPDDMRLYGAVTALGCDVPTDYSVTSTGDGVRVVAQKVKDPQLECFAAMTTVTLFLVPAGALG